MSGTKSTNIDRDAEPIDRVGGLVGGRYRLLRLIGGGGMGTVFEAKHTGTERLVALKFLREELACEESALERFEREAKAADEPATITVRMQRRDREGHDVTAPTPQQSPPESPIPPADSPVSSFGEMP